MIRAIITDLDGAWWAQTPDAMVFDAEWLRKNYGPHQDDVVPVADTQHPEVPHVHADAA